VWSSWLATGSTGRIARRGFSGVLGYFYTFFRGGLPPQAAWEIDPIPSNSNNIEAFVSE
jgi:hypothetical protein